MARSTATTVDGYLAELPDDRRAVVAAVRDAVTRSIPAGYEERVNWGMISWEIPLSRYPDTYHRQPLSYVALAAQKGHYALYLTGAYADPAQARVIEDGFARAGKKLDMGKSCLRFKRLEDIPLDVVTTVIASTPPERYIELYEKSRKGA